MGKKKACGILFFIAIAAALLSMHGCGMYYKADIAGYVKDSATGYGIDGTLLRAYLTEEAAQSGEGYFTETSSMVYNGNPGYFTFTAVWQQLISEYGSEGDMTDLWISAVHEDYSSRTVRVRGITSDGMNIIPDIRLDAVVYTARQVSGLVWDGTLDADSKPNYIDGVRVVLDLASTEKNPDYVAVSSTTQVGDATQAGMYTFVNVTWRDEDNPGQITDEETITISVADPVYTGDKSLLRTIVSGQGVSFMGSDNLIECTK
jgi:hypothetical protein